MGEEFRSPSRVGYVPRGVVRIPTVHLRSGQSGVRGGVCVCVSVCVCLCACVCVCAGGMAFLLGALWVSVIGTHDEQD